MFNFELSSDFTGATVAVLQAEGINYGVLYTVKFREAGIYTIVNQSRCDRFIDRFDDFLLDAHGKAVYRTGQAQFRG